MESSLEYRGEEPRYALKRQWTKGSRVTLEKLFAQFSDKCPNSTKMDELFVNWIFNTYIVNLGQNFVFKVFKNELDSSSDTSDVGSVSPISSPSDTTADSNNLDESNLGSLETALVEALSNTPPPPVHVESSALKTSSSLKEARTSLKEAAKKAHSQDGGEVIVESVKTKKNKTHLEKLQDRSSAEVISPKIITGDDLGEKAQTRGSPSTSRGSVVLDETGKPSSPVHKDSKKSNEEGLANVSQHLVLTQKDHNDPLGNKKIMIGGNSPNKDSGFAHISYEESSGQDKEEKLIRRNENFVANPMIAPKEVSADDIIDAAKQSVKDAAVLIGYCKRPAVLKMVRTYASSNGMTNIVNLLDRRLGDLPRQ